LLFSNIIAEKNWRNFGVFFKTVLVNAKKIITTMLFKKIVNFFRKSVKIANNSDHAIDPRGP
jgi:hypothetical protein